MCAFCHNGLALGSCIYNMKPKIEYSMLLVAMPIDWQVPLLFAHKEQRKKKRKKKRFSSFGFMFFYTILYSFRFVSFIVFSLQFFSFILWILFVFVSFHGCSWAIWQTLDSFLVFSSSFFSLSRFSVNFYFTHSLFVFRSQNVSRSPLYAFIFRFDCLDFVNMQFFRFLFIFLHK